MTSHRTTRLVAFALMLGLALVTTIGFWAPSADAHRGDQSYLYLDVGDGLDARLQMPFIDVAEALGIELRVEGQSTEALIEANAETLRQYALDHVAFESNGNSWALTATEVSRVAGERNPYVEVVFVVEHPQDFRQFAVLLDPFFDEIEDRDALLLVANDLEGGVVDNEADHLVRFTPGDRLKDVDLGDTSQWNNFTASIGAGVDHIRTGPDHILFVLALLVPSVLVWRSSQWQPSTGFRSTLWRLTKILSMFTLAHSVTFTLAGLGILPAPGPKVTETIIALSIAATALHTLRPIFADREWLISLVFGLFHGFGFASLINDLEVSDTTRLVSLLGRNVGIEIGQVVVVLLIFPALYVLRTTRFYRPFLVISSIGLTIAALLWMYERLAEASLSITARIEQLTEIPLSLILIAVFTAIAVGLRLWSDRNDTVIDDRSRSDGSALDAATVEG